MSGQHGVAALLRQPTRRVAVLGLWPAAVVSLVVGIWWGAALYPGRFDWQYQVISNLASRQDNPDGYLVFCVGLGLCFLLLLPLPSYFSLRLRSTGVALARFSAITLLVGMLCSIAVGAERIVIRDLGEHIHKGHEAIALIAFVGLVVGVAGFLLGTLRLHRRAGSLPGWLLLALFMGVMAPIACTAASQLYLYLSQSDLGWVGPSWREMGVPLYLSFAFWQWLTGVGAIIDLFLITVLLPAEVPMTSAPAGGLEDSNPC
jgi:hypothetical protein